MYTDKKRLSFSSEITTALKKKERELRQAAFLLLYDRPESQIRWFVLPFFAFLALKMGYEETKTASSGARVDKLPQQAPCSREKAGRERVVVLLSEFPTVLDQVSFPLDGSPVEVVVAVTVLGVLEG